MATLTAHCLSERQRRRHKLRNLAHSALLLLGMLAVLAICATALWGPAGILWALLGTGLALAMSPSIRPEWLMRLYWAEPPGPADFPDGVRLLRLLAARAGLGRPPTLWCVPSPMLNAFGVGRRDHAAIAVTHGLVTGLTFRELAGVLAHEISHVRNNDLWIMGLAAVLSRLTSVLSWLGQLLLLLNLPLLLKGRLAAPWLVVITLIFAPTVVSLLQLALSRAREYDADLDAAGLTGDPRGLASALARLERRQGRYWEEILLPGRRMPDPSLLRTHPPTAERIRRLLALLEPAEPAAAMPSAVTIPIRRPAPAAPRWHWPGVWY